MVSTGVSKLGHGSLAAASCNLGTYWFSSLYRKQNVRDMNQARLKRLRNAYRLVFGTYKGDTIDCVLVEQHILGVGITAKG